MLENLFLKLTRNRRVQDELAVIRGLDFMFKGYNEAKTISYVRNPLVQMDPAVYMEDVIKKNEELYQTIPDNAFQGKPQQEQTHELIKKATLDTSVQPKTEAPTPQKIEKVTQVPMVDQTSPKSQPIPEVIPKSETKPVVSVQPEKTMTEKVSTTQSIQENKTQTVPPEIKMPERKSKFENAKEQKIPSTSVARAWGFAKLGVSLASSAITGNLMTEESAEKISQTLCRMRGVPLKLGQALSIQEDAIIPKPIKEALERAQKAADIMPQSQLYSVLEKELGKDWESKFSEFNHKPIAAASIGQVHRAKTKDGKDVAVKVQYPGVSDSIDSDLNNLRRIFHYTNILPRTMFVDDLVKNIRIELKEETDYKVEAEKQMAMKQKLSYMKEFNIPSVIPELSTMQVLTSEWVDGLTLEECESLDQEHRNFIAASFFKLVLEQLFYLRYCQTDPNPANYFYDPNRKVIHLIDYGAARSYSKEFVSDYADILYGARNKDAKLVYEASKKIGFLSGEENKEMKEAHVNSVLITGEPFQQKEPFDFGNQNITKRIYEMMPVMLKNRLRPPPPEVYSLHRVLSAAYLTSMRMRAKVPVSKLFDDVYNRSIQDLKSF